MIYFVLIDVLVKKRNLFLSPVLKCKGIEPAAISMYT
jgi:hypothetical protein